MPEPLIVAHQLVKKFGDFTAVDGIDGEVQPGDLGVMAALGLVDSWWSLLALPACALIRLTSQASGVATTYMRGCANLELVTTATMPLFLFSATFFPFSAYGSWAWLVQLSPLYHGVALVGAAHAGVWTASVLGHIAVLVTLSVVALVIAARRIDSLLRK